MENIFRAEFCIERKFLLIIPFHEAKIHIFTIPLDKPLMKIIINFKPSTILLPKNYHEL